MRLRERPPRKGVPLLYGNLGCVALLAKDVPAAKKGEN